MLALCVDLDEQSKVPELRYDGTIAGLKETSDRSQHVNMRGIVFSRFKIVNDGRGGSSLDIFVHV